ncbi:hypothetical protein ACLKA7_008585 [Drosophila subpalustris]
MADESDWDTEVAAGPMLSRPSGGLLRTPPNFRGFPEREPPLIERPTEEETATQTQPDPQVPKETDTAIKSAVNVALAQAHETYRTSQQAGIGNALRDEIRNGFLDMMKLLNDLYRPPVSGSRSEASAATRPDQPGPAPSTGAVPKRPEGQQSQGTRPPTVRPRRPNPFQEPESSSPVYEPPQAANWRNLSDRSPRLNERRQYENMRNNNCNDRTYLKLERWNVKFDGEDSMHSVEDFIFRVEFLQRQYRCAWREVLQGFHLLLAGRAREWYWVHVKHSRVDTWSHLRQALLDRFRGYQTEHDLMQELLQREQNANEGVDDYIHHMRQLASRFQKPLRDRELVKIIKRGLKESVAKYVYAMDIITVDELRQECIEVERNARRRTRSGYAQQTRYSHGVKPSVHELECPPGEPEPPPEDVEEASMRPRLVCWNCGGLDHMWRDCLSKERKIFCYLCGKPDTFSPQRVDCPGNARMSAVRAGQARSGMATAIRKDGQSNRM